MEQPTKRGRGRPRRAVIEEQPSGDSSNTPSFDEGMEEVPESARPSTHGHRSSISNWVGTITQAVVATVGPSFSSRVGRMEAAQMMETARRLGAKEF